MNRPPFRGMGGLPGLLIATVAAASLAGANDAAVPRAAKAATAHVSRSHSSARALHRSRAAESARRRQRRLASAPSASVAATQSLPPGTAGRVIARDPETGTLGAPGPEAMRGATPSMDEAVSRSSEGLVEVHHPDGSVTVFLAGRFQDYTVARRSRDGKVITGCIHDANGRLNAALRDSIPIKALEEQ